MPVFNDEEHVATALKSCLNQTLRDIEVIVVDDASTDATTAIVESFIESDARVRLIKLETNGTAFYARRIGLEQASAPFVLFIDGDDELVSDAAESSLHEANLRGADVVAFGVQVIRADGTTGSHYERSMQPTHRELNGPDILRTLFPVGKGAQGQLWRYLFSRALLLDAYSELPRSLTMVRVNDLPIAFLALMRAQKYVSITRILYRYYFQRGASGHRVTELADYEFTASSISSIDAIGETVAHEVTTRPDSDDLALIYESVRRSVVGRVLEYVRGIADDGLRAFCLERLRDRVGMSTLVYASADFCPKALPMLASVASPARLSDKTPKHILLRTGNLRTGGVQGVLVAQAAHLLAAGFEVTIAVDAEAETHFRLPSGIDLVRITGASRAARVIALVELCEERGIDVVIDHHVLYNENWPFSALAMSARGVSTVGWLHTFGLRPILDGNSRTSFLQQYLPLLSMVVALSRTDVAYWKLLGIENVACLPNPASPLAEELPRGGQPRPAPTGPIQIVWWGRLEQSVKQVTEVLEIGSILADLGVDFRINIIGPDGKDLSADKLNKLATSLGIEENVVTRGPLHHDDLLQAIEQSHVYVSTSVIEGYPLALVEAQSLGLPVVMYELPWLATAQGNEGMISVPQGDRRAAALALAALARDNDHYTTRSQGSLAAAEAAVTHDFPRLYSELVSGRLSEAHMPDPEIADARLIVAQSVRFAERVIRREGRALQRATATAVEQRRKAKALSQELEEARSTIRRLSGMAKHEPKVPSVVRTGIKGWLMGLLPTTMKQSSFYARHHHNTSVIQKNQILGAQASLETRLDRLSSSLEALHQTARGANTHLESALVERLERLERAVVESTRESRGGVVHMRRMTEALSMQVADSAEHFSRSDAAVGDLAHSVTTFVETVKQSLNAATKRSSADEESRKRLIHASRTIDEVLWSSVFSDTSLESSWFLERTLSPGRWAVGYQFLYVLYRILDEVRPASILELGLGQSSKMTGQYALNVGGVRHVIVEHDADWIATFAANFALSSASTVVRLDLTQTEAPSGAFVHRYADFATSLGEDEYDLVIVDGPFGFDQDLARVDVLDLIPRSLGKRFVIMLDDAHRRGERALIELVVAALDQSGIPYVSAMYKGQKDLWIVASADLAYLATL
ncbi:hypothetical protein BFN01_04480 [Microbacterium sp. AR7-10]|nr:hypothetical protein BFN01_04480 [Microbacterium sp. AR7-10]